MTKPVNVKNVIIGGGAPISIQSMTNTSTENVRATIEQVNALKDAGADIVRIAVPNEKSATALKEIIRNVDVPIVGDIHYDYKLALKAIDAGVHKIRINPSNTSPHGIKEIAYAARAANIPIRVGINQGSIHKEQTGEELANLCLESARLLEDNGFSDIVLAVKTSDTLKTIEAYMALSRMTDYPLHIGLTESGTLDNGIVKSSIVLGVLLLEGIGDTMRVSLTGDPVEEVILAKRILRSIGFDKEFVEVIACPTCARCSIDIEGIAKAVEEYTKNLKKPMKIAIMGCTVNGIGEAENADFGVYGAGEGKALIMIDKKPIMSVKECDIVKELLRIVDEYKSK